jgi:leucyl aminopeptidase
MRISVINKQIQALAADALIVNVFEGITALSGTTGAVDSALGATDGTPGDGAIGKLLALGDFRGQPNEVAVLYTNGLIPTLRVIVVGLGRREELNTERVRQASGAAMRKARDLGCKHVTSVIHGSGIGMLDVRVAAQATVEGALLGTYQFRDYKSHDSRQIDELTLVEFNPARVAAVTTGARDGETIAAGTNVARTLINRAPNDLAPTSLAQFCTDMAKQVGLSCMVLDEGDIADLHMGGILAVTSGSAQPPRFVILEHVPTSAEPREPGPDAPPLVFIGKGVTFDTGGISLKDPQSMLNMKGDMGGAAAVIGALRAIHELNLPRRVIGLLPLVENMPGSRAFRPGDVITMMSGATVEITSTDAEGRLILADALQYAKRYTPCGVVDLATLTGACVVALGEGIAAGLFSNDDAWAERVLAAAGTSGEKLWQLPLYAEYGNKIKSDIADMRNSPARNAGVGASAYFLRRFVENEQHAEVYPWVHIDMAPMMFSSDTRGYQPRGAIGYGVRTLVALARMLD